MAEKVIFPESVQEKLSKFESILLEEGFFNNEEDFPKGMEETAKTHLWNFLGEIFITKFIEGKGDDLPTEEEVNGAIVSTIIQTNLDSLMNDNLIDGIENEHGDMVYFMTEKGKEVVKKIDPNEDVDNS